jgi:hypothetical protein
VAQRTEGLGGRKEASSSRRDNGGIETTGTGRVAGLRRAEQWSATNTTHPNQTSLAGEDFGVSTGKTIEAAAEALEAVKPG